MSTSFTNNINTKIIVPFEVLIKEEFASDDVGFNGKDFEIIPQEDVLLGLRGAGQVRDYSVQVIYKYKAGADYKRDDQFEHLSNIAERFKTLLWNNTDTDNWFDCRVDSINYEQDEDDKELFKAIIDCTFSREETI